MGRARANKITLLFAQLFVATAVVCGSLAGAPSEAKTKNLESDAPPSRTASKPPKKLPPKKLPEQLAEQPPAEPTAKVAKKSKLSPRWAKSAERKLASQDSPALRRRLGEYHYEHKDYQKAANLLSPIVKSLNAEGLRILGSSLNRIGQPRDGVRHLQAALAMESENPAIHLELAKAHKALGQKDIALEHFKLAVGSKKASSQAYEEFLAVLLEDPAKKYEARMLVTDMVQKFGPKEKFLTHLCVLYFEGGFIEQAIAECRRGIQKNVNRPENHVYLGLAYKTSGEAEKARSVLQRAGQRFPASEPAQWAAGQFAIESKSFELAEGHLSKAVINQPKSERSHLALAEARYNLKKYAEALKSYSEHCRLTRKVSNEFKKAASLLLAQDPSHHQRYSQEMAICMGSRLPAASDSF